MSTITFGYTVDEIMGDKYPFKDYIDGTNHFSASSFQSHHDTEIKKTAYDCVVGNSSVGYYTIEFGNYPQDGISDMAKQPIKWLVLEKVNGMALLMSLDILDSKQMFNMTREQAQTTDYSNASVYSYENSDLRKWLNEEFYNKAFDSNEKEYIVQYDATSDKVFLPSASEVNSYFRLEKQDFSWNPIYSGLSVRYDMIGNPWWFTKATAYAKNSAERIAENGGYVKSASTSYVNSFWTRTFNGLDTQKTGKKVVTYTINDGKSGGSIINPHGVRPCIWISFDPTVRSAKWQEWDSLGGKIASGLVSGYLDTVLPGVGLFLP